MSRYGTRINDAIQSAVAVNFHPEHGAPYWIDRATDLGMDYKNAQRELTTVESLDVLGKFPEKMLAETTWQNFVPKSVVANDGINVYETGGTLGVGKRVPWHRSTFDAMMEWALEEMRKLSVPENGSWIYMGPTGPHIFGWSINDAAHRMGATVYNIDLDTRYIKQLATALVTLGMKVGIPRDASPSQKMLGILKNPRAIRYIKNLKKTAAVMEGYMQHVVNQVRPILEIEKPNVWVTTPKILEVLPQYFPDVSSWKEDLGVEFIITGGTSFNPEMINRFRSTYRVPIVDIYGNTWWGPGFPDPSIKDKFVYAPPEIPPTVFRIVDPNSIFTDVPYGKGGRIMISRLTKELFAPNIEERDFATREKPKEEGSSDRVSNIQPQAGVVEGVY